jgi:Winged helix DNA-binding domain
VKVLTARQLNRARLARQMLLERVDLPVPRVLERMAGLQAQYAPSMYIGLWTRIAGFPRERLTELLEQRVVVQGTLQRSTIHLVSRDDYWAFDLAVREGRLAWYMRVARDRPDVKELQDAAERLREVLRDGPLKRADMDKMFGAASRTGLHLMVSMLRIPPSGTWARRRADLYASAVEELGPPRLTAAEALTHVVKRYLGGFGPASRDEIAGWLGLPVGSIAPALETLTLRRFRAEDGAELVDLPRAPLPDPDTPAPVRFLPTYDATLLAHARRAQILPEEHRSKVFHTKMPQSIGTFTVDGAVAGTWRYTDGRVVTEEFARLRSAVRREVAEEAERLTEFHR